MQETICAGTKRDGTPCVVKASDGSDFCWHHDPDKATARVSSAHRAGKAGGRGRGAKSKSELVERIRQDLRSVAAGVLDGSIGSRKGDTIVKCLRAELAAIEAHRRAVEDEQFDKRLTELEREILD